VISLVIFYAKSVPKEAFRDGGAVCIAENYFPVEGKAMLISVVTNYLHIMSIKEPSGETAFVLKKYVDMDVRE